MKFLFSALIVFLLAVVIALIAREDPGYVVINYRDWTVETSLILAIVAALLGFVALYLLVRFLVNVKHLPRNLGQWRQRRRELESQRALNRGVVALISGQWMEAERDLIRATADGRIPMINYLFAARAAEKLGARGRRDKYLELARQSMPGAETAVGLTRAELLIQEGKMENALEILESLRRSNLKQEAVTKRLLTLYREVQDWQRLLQLIPSARHHKVIDETKARELETLAYSGLLTQAGKEGDLKRLHELWQAMHKTLRKQSGVVATYVQQLVRCDAHEEAERVLHYFLSRQWNEDLAYLYGVIQPADALIHLSRAENLFKNHKDSPAMLLTMGRLCKRNALWGKARQFFEACLAMDENPEALSELAGVLEQMGERETALEYYRKVMMMKVPDTVRQLTAGGGEIAQGTLIPAANVPTQS